jgi:uncharacterized membrane protein YeaQ/YmgE (transglycosylase-associated protein family)
MRRKGLLWLSVCWVSSYSVVNQRRSCVVLSVGLVFQTDASLYVPPNLQLQNPVISLIVALIIGLIVGALAKLIVPGREPGGCLVTALIGIAGSFVAYFIGRALGWTTEDPHHFLRPVGFIPSLIGAIILLVIYHAIRGRRPPGS